jgi:hypothetical protein
MKNEKMPPTWDMRCGTEAGAKAHSRRGEKWCAACRKAELVAHQRRRDMLPKKPHHQTHCPACGAFAKLGDFESIICTACGTTTFRGIA